MLHLLRAISPAQKCSNLSTTKFILLKQIKFNINPKPSHACFQLQFQQKRHQSGGATALSGSALEFMQLNSPQMTGGGAIFSDTWPVLATSDLLCTFKDLPGMTWIQTIIIGTILIRLIVGLPIAVLQQRTMAKLENLQPQMRSLALELKSETGLAIRKFGWDEATAKKQFIKSYKKHWRSLVEENNCHPMRTLCLGLLQIPIWICFSSAIRNIVYGLPLPTNEAKALRWAEMYEEYLPWVANLTISDGYFFPLIFLTVNLVNIQLHSLLRPQTPIPQTKLQKVLPYVFGAGIIAISVLATYVPSAVSMYWAVSSSAALAQNVLIKIPKIRQILGIPKTLSTS